MKMTGVEGGYQTCNSTVVRFSVSSLSSAFGNSIRGETEADVIKFRDKSSRNRETQTFVPSAVKSQLMGNVWRVRSPFFGIREKVVDLKPGTRTSII